MALYEKMAEQLTRHGAEDSLDWHTTHRGGRVGKKSVIGVTTTKGGRHLHTSMLVAMTRRKLLVARVRASYVPVSPGNIIELGTNRLLAGCAIEADVVDERV
jgi:hypothetical protein